MFNRKKVSIQAIALSASALCLVMSLGSDAALAGDHGRAGSARMERPMMSRPALPDRAADRAGQRRAAPENVGANTVVERTDDAMTRTTTVTNGQGETMTSSTTVTRDPESGTRSVEVERTGFDGRSSSVSSSTTRTEDGIERTRSVTRPDGTTATREITVTKDDEGKATVEGTQTGFDGETRSIPAEGKNPVGRAEQEPTDTP